MKKLGDYYLVFNMVFMIFCAGCCMNKKSMNYSYNEQYMNHITDSVVAFPHYDDKGSLSYLSCTGFFIDEKHIMTARHCLVNMEEIEMFRELFGNSPEAQLLINYIMKTQIDELKNKPILILKHTIGLEKDILKNINSAPAIKTKLVYMNARDLGIFPDKNDVAILEILDKKEYSKHWLNFAKYDPKPNEDVLTVSMINNSPWFLTRGYVSKVLYEHNKESKISTPIAIIANMTIYPGASGSPLLNNKGEIIGVTSSVHIYKGRQIMDMANFVPGFYLKRFYEAIR